MTAFSETKTVIRCDGSAFGLTCPDPGHTLATGILDARAVLKRRGWVRRPSGYITVDLCPECAKSAVLAPHRGGRPRKSGARR